MLLANFLQAQDRGAVFELKKGRSTRLLVFYKGRHPKRGFRFTLCSSGGRLRILDIDRVLRKVC